MASRSSSIAEIDPTILQASASNSEPVVPNALMRMMAPSLATVTTSVRDRCNRPTVTYTVRYDPYKPPPDYDGQVYCPFVLGEPLCDNRAIIVANLPRMHTAAPAAKRPRTSWLWLVGYALTANSKPNRPLMWACKLCHHHPAFTAKTTSLFAGNTLINASNHMREIHMLDEGGDIWRVKVVELLQASELNNRDYSRVTPFRQNEFKAALLKWIILDNIKYRKVVTGNLVNLIRIANNQAVLALPSASSTIALWVHDMYWHFEPRVIQEICTAKSRIHVSFDGWGSKHEKISVLGIVVHFINERHSNVTRLIGLPELPEHRKTGVAQAAVLYPILQHFGITDDKLGYFVLDNASNNDTTLVELAKSMNFLPKERRLRCMGHILNLIAEQYLFGQDASSFERDFNAAGHLQRRQLWRQRGELGKLHNLVQHVLASGKRSDLFNALQREENIGLAQGRSLKLVVDGGVRWNASYSMILRALLLCEALDAYAFKLRLSDDVLDLEIYNNDYLTPAEWTTLELIKDHLAVLFQTTKALEGNAKLKEGAMKASHGALWELLPLFEHILNHFEELQIQAQRGDFNQHKGIQSSITLAWTKTKEYYGKTDASIAWMASVVLHPRFKWRYFETHWKGPQASYVRAGKATLRKLWEDRYKTDDLARIERSPEPELERPSFIEIILNEVAPVATASIPRPTARHDQLALYLAEGTIGDISLMDYWRSREFEWPQLTAMAYDLISIPAMSSECERVFSSCAKQTTPESSRLSGETLAQTGSYQAGGELE